MQKVKQFKDKPVAFHFNGTEQFATPSVGCLVFVLEFFVLDHTRTAFIRVTTVPTHHNDSMSWNVQIKILKTDLYIVY